jgi:hypothetical protein
VNEQGGGAVPSDEGAPTSGRASPCLLLLASPCLLLPASPCLLGGPASGRPASWATEKGARRAAAGRWSRWTDGDEPCDWEKGGRELT